MKNQNDVVIIELDRPRELRYSHKALKVLEELTGKTILDIEEILLEGRLSISLIEKFVYAGLLKDAKEHGETLTIDQVEVLLDDVKQYSKIIEAIGKAFTAAFRAETGDTEGNQSQPAQGPDEKGDTTGKKVNG